MGAHAGPALPLTALAPDEAFLDEGDTVLAVPWTPPPPRPLPRPPALTPRSSFRASNQALAPSSSVRSRDSHSSITTTFTASVSRRSSSSMLTPRPSTDSLDSTAPSLRRSGASWGSQASARQSSCTLRDSDSGEGGQASSNPLTASTSQAGRCRLLPAGAGAGAGDVLLAVMSGQAWDRLRGEAVGGLAAHFAALAPPCNVGQREGQAWMGDASRAGVRNTAGCGSQVTVRPPGPQPNQATNATNELSESAGSVAEQWLAAACCRRFMQLLPAGQRCEADAAVLAALLARLRPFVGLPASVLHDLAATAVLVTTAPGGILFHEGEPADPPLFYIMLAGSCEVWRRADSRATQAQPVEVAPPQAQAVESATASGQVFKDEAQDAEQPVPRQENVRSAYWSAQFMRQAGECLRGSCLPADGFGSPGRVMKPEASHHPQLPAATTGWALGAWGPAVVRTLAEDRLFARSQSPRSLPWTPQPHHPPAATTPYKDPASLLPAPPHPAATSCTPDHLPSHHPMVQVLPGAAQGPGPGAAAPASQPQLPATPERQVVPAGGTPAPDCSTAAGLGSSCPRQPQPLTQPPPPGRPTLQQLVAGQLDPQALMLALRAGLERRGLLQLEVLNARAAARLARLVRLLATRGQLSLGPAHVSLLPPAPRLGGAPAGSQEAKQQPGGGLLLGGAAAPSPPLALPHTLLDCEGLGQRGDSCVPPLPSASSSNEEVLDLVQEQCWAAVLAGAGGLVEELAAAHCLGSEEAERVGEGPSSKAGFQGAPGQRGSSQGCGAGRRDWTGAHDAACMHKALQHASCDGLEQMGELVGSLTVPGSLCGLEVVRQGGQERQAGAKGEEQGCRTVSVVAGRPTARATAATLGEVAGAGGGAVFLALSACGLDQALASQRWRWLTQRMEQLQAAPPFSSFAPAQLQALALFVKTRQLRDCIFSPGQRDDELFVVTQGAVRLSCAPGSQFVSRGGSAMRGRHGTAPASAHPALTLGVGACFGLESALDWAQRHLQAPLGKAQLQPWTQASGKAGDTKAMHAEVAAQLLKVGPGAGSSGAEEAGSTGPPQAGRVQPGPAVGVGPCCEMWAVACPSGPCQLLALSCQDLARFAAWALPPLTELYRSRSTVLASQQLAGQVLQTLNKDSSPRRASTASLDFTSHLLYTATTQIAQQPPPTTPVIRPPRPGKPPLQLPGHTGTRPAGGWAMAGSLAGMRAAGAARQAQAEEAEAQHSPSLYAQPTGDQGRAEVAHSTAQRRRHSDDEEPASERHTWSGPPSKPGPLHVAVLAGCPPKANGARNVSNVAAAPGAHLPFRKQVDHPATGVPGSDVRVAVAAQAPQAAENKQRTWMVRQLRASSGVLSSVVVGRGGGPQPGSA
ncbi:hypothetical protein QJQ45_025166, partial [Haematococcus lacustris]